MKEGRALGLDRGRRWRRFEIAAAKNRRETSPGKHRMIAGLHGGMVTRGVVK